MKFALAYDEDQSRKADHRDFEGARGWRFGRRSVRKHGVSDASVYKWKVKFGRLDVSVAKLLSTLEDENARLKRHQADAMRDNMALKDILGKKRLRKLPAGRSGPGRIHRWIKLGGNVSAEEQALQALDYGAMRVRAAHPHQHS